MKQIVKLVSGPDFETVTHKVKNLTQELNEVGYKLTFATSESRNDKICKVTNFMLVFTQEE